MSQADQTPPSAPSNSSPSVPIRRSKPRRKRPVWVHKAYGIVFYDDWLLDKAIELFGAAEVEVDPELSSNQCMRFKSRICLRVWRNSRLRIVRDGTTWRGCVSLAENNTLGLDPKMPPPEIIEKIKETLGTTQEPEWYAIVS